MWRFKPSKYKNAIPKIPKKGEGWITDISVGSLPSFGNHIKASASLMAFNIDSGGGGNLGILSLNESGSKSKGLNVLYAHSEFVTDFEFCPYDDGILATCSQDQHIKLWRLAEDNLSSNVPCNPEIDILTQNKVEALKFNPQADCIISTAEDNIIHLWDVNKKQSILADSSHEDTVQCISWKHSGEFLASCGKDKKLRIWDPRDSSKNQIVASHSNNRDSRVVWLGDTEQLLTTGFGSGREREVLLRDIRKLEEPVASYSGDSSLGVYIPLYDPDTNMLFLIAKADTAISFWEVLNHAPFLQEATKFMGEVQAKGAALVPKRALEVMDGEVNRVLLLGQNCIVPISFQVPRKSYREFHADLFPDTFAPEPSLTVPQWQAGEKSKVLKISLKPNSGLALKKTNHHLGSGAKKEFQHFVCTENDVDNESNEKVTDPKELQTEKPNTNKSEKPTVAKKPIPPTKPKSSTAEEATPTPKSTSSATSKFIQNRKQALENNIETSNNQNQKTPSPSVRRSVRTFGIRVSKFRHLNGNIFPKECHITDLPVLTRTIPGECNGFHANEKRVAVPIGAPGNFLAILELEKTGRASAVADMPGVLTGTSIMDFAWDPFDSSRLVVTCDTGDIQIWIIPNGGLEHKLEEPSSSFRGHSEKANIVKFHSCARDILATASSDLTIKVWDLQTQEQKICLTGHTDQILNFCWSPDGCYIATVAKDQRVRIYNPRNSTEAIKEGSGPQGTRGARVVWVLNGTHLAAIGFSKVSERQIYLYNCEDISNPIGSIGLDVSPATLIPYYDEDSSTLFLTGRGDSVIFAYEVATDSPYFHPLSHYKCNNPHQSLSFLHKHICNVREVEFARAIRLSSTSIEPISFHVPRLRSEYFQDDLFPPTRKTWEPSITSVEWLAGKDLPLELVDLRPDDMMPLSEAPPPVKATSNKSADTTPNIMFEGEVVLQSSLAFLQNTKEKEEKIMQSMSSQCELRQNSLPQEAFEGVDPDEWEQEEKEHAQKNS